MRTLHLFPTTDRADEWLGQQAAPAGRPLGAMLGRHAATLRQLEEAVAHTALDGRRRLPAAARALLLSRLLREVDVGPYRVIADKPGFRRAVEAFLDESAAGGIDFRILARAAGRLPAGLCDRLGALSAIGIAYLDALERLKLADPVFAAAEGCHRLAAGEAWPSLLDGVGVVRVVDVIDWPPGRLALLGAVASGLSRRGGRVRVELPRSDRAELAVALDPAWRALEGLGADLELAEVPLASAALAPQGFDAADQVGEAREIAERIARLRDEGVPLDGIVVAARAMADLAPLLGDALERVGLPARDRRGRSLDEAVTIRVALDLARLDGPAAATRERIASLVGSKAIDLRGLVADAPSPASMCRWLRACAVRDRARERDGRDGFEARIERLARSEERAGKTAEAERIRLGSTALQNLFQVLDKWPKNATFKAHSRALLQLLDTLRVPSRLRYMAFGEPPGDVSAPDLVDRRQAGALAFEQAAWSQLTRALGELEDAARALGVHTEPIARDDFAAWLEERCSAETMRPGSSRGGSIELLELGDLAGRQVAHVFIAGVYDGRLPGPPENDPLLADDERWRVNEALGRAAFRVAPQGTQASPFPARQLLQAVSLALALGAATRSITLSRPRADDRGRPLAPSPLLALAPPVRFERVPFRPLDARLGSRDTASIGPRRVAALERARWFADRSSSPSIHSGNLESIEGLLAPLVPGTVERPLSPAALERALGCGFRYTAESFLRAREASESDDEAGPLEVGRLAHLAAEKAVEAILDAKLWRLDALEAAVAIGLAAATRAVEEAEPSTVLGHPELWDVARQKLLGRLAHLLEREITATADTGARPLHLELAFGLEGATLPALDLDGVHVAGRIDRVDAGPLGVEVLDYKSGGTEAQARKLSSRELLVTQFQLPLYVVALSRLLPQAQGTTVDAAYVSLRDARRTKGFLAALDGEPLDQMTARLSEAVRGATSRIRSGNLPPDPRTCAHCDLRPVCRIPRPESV